jgi:hypothetical protein
MPVRKARKSTAVPRRSDHQIFASHGQLKSPPKSPRRSDAQIFMNFCKAQKSTAVLRRSDRQVFAALRTAREPSMLPRTSNAQLFEAFHDNVCNGPRPALAPKRLTTHFTQHAVSRWNDNHISDVLGNVATHSTFYLRGLPSRREREVSLVPSPPNSSQQLTAGRPEARRPSRLPSVPRNTASRRLQTLPADYSLVAASGVPRRQWHRLPRRS